MVLSFAGANSDKEIKYIISSTNPHAKLLETDENTLYPLTKYKVDKFLIHDDFGIY
jgi:hypothetical protein